MGERGGLTLAVPFGDFGRLLSSVVGLFRDGVDVLLVVLAPFKDLLEHGRGEIGQGDRVVGLSNVFYSNPINLDSR